MTTRSASSGTDSSRTGPSTTAISAQATTARGGADQRVAPAATDADRQDDRDRLDQFNGDRDARAERDENEGHAASFAGTQRSHSQDANSRCLPPPRCSCSLPPLRRPPLRRCRTPSCPDNVEYLGSIKQDVGLTTGAKVVGDRLFVTSGKNISIYDISNPATPQALGSMNDQHRVGERGGADQRQGPRGRQRLLLASCPSASRALAVDRLRPVLRRPRPGEHQGGRLDPDRQPHGRVRARLPVLLRPRGHDHRRARDPRRQAADGGRQLDRRAEARRASTRESCHHIREIRPGRPAHRVPAVLGDLGQRRRTRGASPEHPKVLYTGEAAKFVHSARWPRDGARQVRAHRRREELHRPLRAQRTASSRPTAPRRCTRGKSTKFEGPLAQVAARRQRHLRRRQAGRRRTSAARSTGSRSTRRSRTAASSRSPSTRTACASCRSSATARSASRASSLSLGSSSSSPKWARQGRRRLLDRLRPRHRHPPLEGRALRPGRREARARPGHRRRRLRRRRPMPRNSPSAPRWRRCSSSPAGRRGSATWSPAADPSARECGRPPTASAGAPGCRRPRAHLREQVGRAAHGRQGTARFSSSASAAATTPSISPMRI